MSGPAPERDPDPGPKPDPKPDPKPGPKPEALDPRGLIREAYRMEGLTPEDCRSIFFDWALGRGEAEGDPRSVAALLEHYGPGREDHPMTQVLREGARAPAGPGGRRGRRGGRGRG